MTITINDITDRLVQLGYEVKEGDEAALLFALGQTEEKIKNICNVSEIPDGLFYKAIDMACGSFLGMMNMTGQLSGYSVSGGERLIKTVSEGDTTVTYQDSSAASDLSEFLNALSLADSELIKYRKLCW